MTDRGLAAAETVEADHTSEALDRLEQIESAPEPDVETDTDLRTRLRGD